MALSKTQHREYLVQVANCNYVSGEGEEEEADERIQDRQVVSVWTTQQYAFYIQHVFFFKIILILTI